MPPPTCLRLASPSPTWAVRMHKRSSRRTAMTKDTLPAKQRASYSRSSLSFCPSAHSFGDWPRRVQVLAVLASRTWQVWLQRSLGKADCVSLRRSPMVLQVPASQRTRSLGISAPDLFVIWEKECAETQGVCSWPFLCSHFPLQPRAHPFVLLSVTCPHWCFFLRQATFQEYSWHPILNAPLSNCR